VTGRALNRYNAWAAIRKRARAAGFLTPVGCHTWRATGITIYLENDGRLEHAQQMAGHESPRTTKLYDRTKDEITLGEVERIRLGRLDPNGFPRGGRSLLFMIRRLPFFNGCA
jgi:integrase/recombinase XerD